MSTERYTQEALTIEVADNADTVHVRWLGKSTARDPAKFILPVLTRALERSRYRASPMVLDFQEVEYLNSSTITPIIRILHQAARGASEVTVLYKKDLKWQALSFTALEVFHTESSRIVVRGM